ncbi:hypothetical protein [Candidatus Symbiopectobacterium sp. PLON1]|uniref:hypothetical protein n=1 Tax=Candidatus Symbiopectobacterium sp. PLON1 TaxID=2794575 RepID=UPI0025C680E3|nr:hypothetical protein [Candidatus Symbiopectobacterium sp. PLON1]
MAIPFATSLTGTLALLVIAMALLSALSATGWALPGDVAPASMVASVDSIQNFRRLLRRFTLTAGDRHDRRCYWFLHHGVCQRWDHRRLCRPVLLVHRQKTDRR